MRVSKATITALLMTVSILLISPANAVAKSEPVRTTARIDITSVDKNIELLDLDAQSETMIFIEKDPKAAAVNWAIIKTFAYEEWYTITISFIPSDSGKIKLQLRGSHYDDMDKNHRSIIFDNVQELENGLIKNPSFEELNDDQTFVGWSPTPEKFIINGGIACEGANSVQVWHDQSIEQEFEVTAWQKCVIEATFKLAK